MPNTLDSINEARELVDQLIEKTRSKKLDWHEGVPGEGVPGDIGSEEAEKAFFVTIGDFNFIIYSFDTYPPEPGFGILTRDQSGAILLHIQLATRPKFGFSLPGELELSVELARLHELARRSVFGIDSKLSRAKSLLLAL